MLPGEREKLPALRRHFKEQFDFSARYLADGLNVVNKRISYRKEFPEIVERATLGLQAIMCRRFRQAIALCQISQADAAEGVCRSMFEGFLAQAFVCRNSVTLRRRNVDQKTGKVRPTKVDTFGVPLTQEFRAKLYVAHQAIQWKKQLDKMKTIPGLKHYAARQLKDHRDDHQKWCQEVGTSWARVLRSNTCAGLSIEDLSFSFGAKVHFWYGAVYGIQSGLVHGGNFTITCSFTGPEGVPRHKWSDFPTQVFSVLRTSTFLFGLQKNEFNRLLDRNHKPYVAADLFTQNGEFDRVFEMNLKKGE